MLVSFNPNYKPNQRSKKVVRNIKGIEGANKAVKQICVYRGGPRTGIGPRLKALTYENLG